MLKSDLMMCLRKNKSWYVYTLKCADGTFYTGITNDLKKRIVAHENGKGAKYTRGRGPFELYYKEPHETRSEATKREIEIKRLSRQEKMNWWHHLLIWVKFLILIINLTIRKRACPQGVHVWYC